MVNKYAISGREGHSALKTGFFYYYCNDKILTNDCGLHEAAFLHFHFQGKHVLLNLII